MPSRTDTSSMDVGSSATITSGSDRKGPRDIDALALTAR